MSTSINAAFTADRLAERLTNRRKAMAARLTSEEAPYVIDLASEIAGIATMEGEYRVTMQIEDLEKREPVVEAEGIRNYLIRMMSNGADDSWSGRSNDLQRAYHDGQLRAAMRWLENNPVD